MPVWGMAETVTAVAYGRLDRPGTVHRLLKSSLGGELVRADAKTPEEDCATFVASGSPAHGVTLRIVDDRGRLRAAGQHRPPPGACTRPSHTRLREQP